MEKICGIGLTFDDVLIAPVFADVQPSQVDTSVNLTEGISLKIPFLSAGMDTVTESQMAIAIARYGGLGIIHRNLSIDSQASEVDRVKRSEHGVITDPFFLTPNHYLYEASKLMEKYRISGVPIVEHEKLVGIITNRDLSFEVDYSKKVYEVMTHENLITGKVGTTLDQAKEILTRHKIEKLPIVDDAGNLKGLITIKDIKKSIKYPLSTKDSLGRLIVGAAVGIKDDYLERVQALVKRKVDVLALEIPHGHAKEVLEAIRQIKGDFPDMPLMAGNVATAQAAQLLVDAGADIIKVGIGPSSVSTKRMIAGVGVPQITAILESAKVASSRGVPVVADGGVRFSGDIVKTFAAGASACMMGNLFAGCEESPGVTELFAGRKYKTYRGTETSLHDEPGFTRLENDDDHSKASSLIISRGVEGRITYKGNLSEVLQQLLGGLVFGMSYAGCRTIEDMHKNARFMQVTPAGLRESHPHDVQITRESPNYFIM